MRFNSSKGWLRPLLMILEDSILNLRDEITRTSAANPRPSLTTLDVIL
jgi:hypothetical protein